MELKPKKRCPTCQKLFVPVAAKKYCSAVCREANANTRKSQEVATALTNQKLTPAAVMALRSQILKNLETQITYANEVIEGTRVWTATQARVFQTIINKGIPDLNANFIQHEHNIVDVPQMTRSQLEQMAAAISDKNIKPAIEGVVTEKPRHENQQPPTRHQGHQDQQLHSGGLRPNTGDPHEQRGLAINVPRETIPVPRREPHEDSGSDNH